MTTSISFENGKYTIREAEDGTIEFLRHGEPWTPMTEEFRYSGLFSSILHEVSEMQGRLNAMDDAQKAQVEQDARIGSILEMTEYMRSTDFYRNREEAKVFVKDWSEGAVTREDDYANYQYWLAMQRARKVKV